MQTQSDANRSCLSQVRKKYIAPARTTGEKTANLLAALLDLRKRPLSVHFGRPSMRIVLQPLQAILVQYLRSSAFSIAMITLTIFVNSALSVAVPYIFSRQLDDFTTDRSTETGSGPLLFTLCFWVRQRFPLCKMHSAASLAAPVPMPYCVWKNSIAARPNRYARRKRAI